MQDQARVVIIGGGVIGASILYHLSKLGCSDAIMLERSELTSGSTWHAAGGMHTINGDPNVAKLQQYTIELYREIEQLSGQDIGLHMTGGIMLAATAVAASMMPPVICRPISWPESCSISLYSSIVYCCSLATFGSPLMVCIPPAACHVEPDVSSDRSSIMASLQPSLLK